MPVCPRCGATEPDDRARFCARCGSPYRQAFACPSCGAEVPTAAAFCPACGLRVPDAPDEGRKLVTILFADVAGSTELGERLDPEHLQEVMRTYFRAMQEEIEAEGGSVEKFIGDAVMAAFGVPLAHEDDAARAMRAALRMRRRLASVNEELLSRFDLTLAVRIGVNTGAVVTTASARPELGMVSGDAVNAAARLQQAARPGQIVVGERTARSSRGFRLRGLGPQVVKGKSLPVNAVELLGAASEDQPIQQERGVPGLHAPMVGRDHELGFLRSLHQRLRSESRAQLVTVYGDPGVGKSRLVNEFLAWASAASQVSTLTGRCLPYGEGITYWPLAEMLKAETGVLDSDPPGVALERISRLAGGALREDADPERAAAALAFTFGLEDPRFGFADMPPRQVRLEVHSAWRSFFTGLSSRGPLIVVVEDIHWADDQLLELIDELIDRIAGPVMFLCPARPELLQVRPAWGGGKRNFSSISLEPLSATDAAGLVDALLDIDELSSAARDRILGRAEGNPFFLEEIVRQLIDEGRIVRADHRRRATVSSGGLEGIDIPDTVQGVLAARIDLLAPQAKRVLRSAAVVGRTFWAGPVARLVDGERTQVEDILSGLEHRELVSSRVGSTIAGEREFAFKHILTRDVAYETLPRRERGRAHGIVAGWIEDVAGERRREFADLLAHHHQEAYEAARADPSLSREALERARRDAFDALLLSSLEGRSRMLLDKAEAHADRALAIADGGDERALALEALGMAALWGYRGDTAWSRLTGAVDERLGRPLAEREAIASLCARAVEAPTRWPASMRANPSEEDVARYVRIGLTHAVPGGEAWTRLMTAKAFWPFAYGRQGFSESEREAAIASGEEAADAALRAGRLDLASAALDAVDSVDFIRGYHGRCWPTIERRLALVPGISDPWEVGDILQMAADVALSVGRYRDALRWGDEGFRRSREGPMVWGACLAWHALARYRLGNWAGVLDDLASLESGARWSQPPYFLTTCRAVAALVHELRGEPALADRIVGLVDEVDATTNARAAPWLARLAALRGDGATAFAWLETRRSGSLMMRGQLLEARCDVVSELAAWDGVEDVVAEARAWAGEAGLEALPHHADRLEGRAAAARGDLERAASILVRARDGFGALGAAWDAALAALWLAEVLAAMGSDDAARAEAEGTRSVLERVGAVREADRARRWWAGG
jgi:class 3 adenylate cyclase